MLPSFIIDQERRSLVSERDGTTKGARVLLNVAPVRVPELHFARREEAVGRKAENLQHDDGDELDFVHGDGELVLDLVEANRVMLPYPVQREHAPM